MLLESLLISVRLTYFYKCKIFFSLTTILLPELLLYIMLTSLLHSRNFKHSTYNNFQNIFSTSYRLFPPQTTNPFRSNNSTWECVAINNPTTSFSTILQLYRKS